MQAIIFHRFACGTTGYNLLIQQKFPLPSVRTLERRMSKIDFRPGILNNVLTLMNLKVHSYNIYTCKSKLPQCVSILD